MASPLQAFVLLHASSCVCEVESTHHDTTILSSLDFCYTFLHKTSYQAVVSAGKKKNGYLDLTFNRCIIYMNHSIWHHYRFAYLFFAAGQHADNAKTN